MSSKKKPESLAEKISSLVTAAPTSFGSDDEAEETKAKVVDYDDEIDENNDFKLDFGSSNIRKQNVGLLEDSDKRYKAKKISKKQIFNEDDSSEGSEEEDESDMEDNNVEESDDESVDEQGGSEEESDEHILEDKKDDEGDDDDAEDDEDDEDDEDNEDDDDEDDDNDDYFDDSIDLSNPLRKDRATDKGIKTMSNTNVRAEIEKGNCVREQLKLWENLLEMRIKLQKCLVNSNKMPQYDLYKDYASSNDFKKNCDTAKEKLSGLLSNLLDLQSNLLHNFPETKNILITDRKRKADNGEKGCDDKYDMDEEIPSDTEDEKNSDEDDVEEEEEEEESGNPTLDEGKIGPPKKRIKLSEYESILSKNHAAFVDYRNSVIQKWNDKTRIATGVISKGVNQPAVKQIEFALANKDKLLKKTQLKRSEYDIIGKSSASLDDNDGRRVQEHDTEIYDDDDFYHQLLRELIEYKSADITDPIQLSKQWIQLQNMRSKMKRKIDTRATKGRRIRYNVHQKLVNFMAPITVFDTWTDHAKDELYSSLFGKIKPVGEELKEVKPT